MQRNRGRGGVYTVFGACSRPQPYVAFRVIHACPPRAGLSQTSINEIGFIDRNEGAPVLPKPFPLLKTNYAPGGSNFLQSSWDRSLLTGH
jgi:hypothetical protein